MKRIIERNIAEIITVIVFVTMYTM